jgi:CHAT domain-containing protein
MTSYRVDWCAGPNAQIELFRTSSDAGLNFKYTPPFRATLRPPVEIIPITSNDLRAASMALRGLAGRLVRGLRDVEPPAEATADVESDMLSLGGLLYDLVMTDSARHDLRLADCFVDFGIEEVMLHYPWELMHDGEDYICLKHSFGRFVSSVAQSAGPAKPKSWFGDAMTRVSVLLISVPAPQPRAGSHAPGPPLAAAEREARTIARVLSSIDNIDVTILEGADATLAAVTRTLRTGRFQIVHYCGHATYEANQPTSSALTLWDDDLTAGVVQRLLTRAQPILCVINACETARLPDERALSVYSLARAFLVTGAYLVGSRWKLDDTAGSSFAQAFYQALLGQGEALGNAVRLGRLAARQADAGDHFSWAAYVLYGDPRLCFPRR